MGEPRRPGPHRLVDHELPRRVGQVLLGPDHVGDAHRRVVHGGGEVIGRKPGRPEQHEVPDHPVREPHLSPHQVVEHPVSRLDREADALRAPLVATRIALGGGEPPAAAVVMRGAPGREPSALDTAARAAAAANAAASGQASSQASQWTETSIETASFIASSRHNFSLSALRGGEGGARAEGVGG